MQLSQSDDKEKLKELLQDFKKIFTSIIENRYIFKEDKELYNLVVLIWNEEISEHLKNAPSQLDKVENLIDELKNRGLSGNQLKLKIKIFERLRELYNKFFNKINSYASISNLISDLLDLIKSVLGSLDGLIPFSEPIIEFADALQIGMNLGYSNNDLAY